MAYEQYDWLGSIAHQALLVPVISAQHDVCARGGSSLYDALVVSECWANAYNSKLVASLRLKHGLVFSVRAVLHPTGDSNYAVTLSISARPDVEAQVTVIVRELLSGEKVLGMNDILGASRRLKTMTSLVGRVKTPEGWEQSEHSHLVQTVRNGRPILESVRSESVEMVRSWSRSLSIGSAGWQGAKLHKANPILQPALHGQNKIVEY